MNKTKIEWCDMTWNPVTGCLHNCEYCYARKIANRFSMNDVGRHINIPFKDWENYSIGDKIYSRYFQPRFHSARLEEPQRIKKPQNIFVCSMADFFGDWVPDEWIKQVFAATNKALQHRYLFLTKNPKRYIKLYDKTILPVENNYWFGSTITKETDEYWLGDIHNTFVSIEPIMSDFSKDAYFGTWVIVGIETSNRKGKIIPERKWIENIVNTCREVGVPVFLKSNLSKIWGEPLIQEFPWEL